MFFRIFLYKLKELSRMRWLVGWNFLFPLVLSTAFYLGFGNLISDDPDTFKTIDVGYLNTASTENHFELVLDELEKETDDHIKILNVTKYATEEEAVKAMKAGTISGIYVADEEEISTIVPFNGYDSTVLNEIVREYKNSADLIGQIAKDHPENIQNALDMTTEDIEVIKEHSFGETTSPYLQYFFALLAMSSLFSSWISTFMLQGMCANVSEQGKRFECSPAGKLSAISAGILAGLVLQSLSNAIVVLYIQYVLKINFGAPLLNIMLLTTIGSGVGISIGVFFGSLITKQSLLVAIPLTFSMLCSFFSGLMWHQLKQLVEYYCPIANRLNPAALLTDSLYTLATYGKCDAYYRDIFTMLIQILVCLIISAVLLRRRKYVSL